MGAVSLRWAQLGALACLGHAVACGASVFPCGSTAACGDNGLCEPEGFCSFPDLACASGRRFGQHAGDGLSGTCTDVAADGSTGAASSATSTGGALTTSPGSTSDTTLTSTTMPVVETSIGQSSSSDGGGVSSSSGPPPQRVTEELQVLYLFDSGSGPTVFDRSEVDPPVDLTIMGTFPWVSDGLESVGDGIVLAEGSASKIRVACQASQEISLEAWVTPADPLAEGPARVVTFSVDTVSRNFTLGQGIGLGVDLVPGWTGRLRTTTTSDNGLPSLQVETAIVQAPTHVVFVHDASGDEAFFVDGEEQVTGVRLGDFSTWDSSFSLAIGNEIDLIRPWSGVLHLVAVYSRDLTSLEVEQNFAAGY